MGQQWAAPALSRSKSEAGGAATLAASPSGAVDSANPQGTRLPKAAEFTPESQPHCSPLWLGSALWALPGF